MAKAKVWNDNVHPYKEVFKGEQISIPAKGFIEMDADEALQFQGSFAPMKFDADGNDLPEGYKMIRVERLAADAPSVKVDEKICIVCRYKASSDSDMAEHVKTHSGQLVVDEEAEKEVAAKRKAKGAA